MSDVVFLNGEFMPQTEARISPMDRGFLFGDGVYEVIPVYHGQFFLLDEHLVRLENSLNNIHLDNPYTRKEWQAIAQKLVEANGPEQVVYFQVTRGAYPTRTHEFPKTPINPTVFARSGTRTPVHQDGIRAITGNDIRWAHCDIKSINLLPNVLLREEAELKKAQEVFFVKDGLVTEGSSSNVFIVKDGVVITHPKTAGILPGITRQLVLDIANKLGTPVSEHAISETELKHADEVWATSVSKEVTAVINIDDQPIGTGKPGPMWQQFYEAYQAYKPKAL